MFHDAILQDLGLPSKIVGERICVNQDSSWFLKIHLDKAQQNNVEVKAKTFSVDFLTINGIDQTNCQVSSNQAMATPWSINVACGSREDPKDIGSGDGMSAKTGDKEDLARGLQPHLSLGLPFESMAPGLKVNSFWAKGELIWTLHIQVN
ncbi:hypothetical protein GH733_001800, partial [Mirounga leonina]